MFRLEVLVQTLRTVGLTGIWDENIARLQNKGILGQLRAIKIILQLWFMILLTTLPREDTGGRHTDSDPPKIGWEHPLRYKLCHFVPGGKQVYFEMVPPVTDLVKWLLEE